MNGFVCFTLALIQSNVTQETSLSGLLWRASPIAKGVLLLLIIFSIASWAIIFAKWSMLRRAERATEEFLERFRRGKKLSDLYMDSESHKHSPLARVFLARGLCLCDTESI